jgi:hypothetical protein
MIIPMKHRHTNKKCTHKTQMLCTKIKNIIEFASDKT